MKPEYGDVICVNHGIYNHFGIYVDDDHVIHYAGKDEDFFLRNMYIDETRMSKFLGNSNKYYVYKFPYDVTKPIKRIKGEGLNRGYKESAYAMYMLLKIKNKIKYKIYSPEETVKRARSRIGERRFNLGLNNCEYFAIWCKTGVSQSYQVNLVLDAIFIKSKIDIA
ncbi:hypothetical protein HF520_04800 [Romboutsia sp. CE17]|uniref:lecithin retinol acyltransferase family protein n=1 Tax=Romboutsia sp. CE17 TaxID=2724150 RepID=UPI001442AF32|nr:lecithin retinol acyltransferase family protein [Romboutsia sp. CE17]QJA08306.1 hypothetical protein HF520_04800 [Romboutsia sp. CE17]